MGLLSSSRHFHTHDNSVNITFPENMKLEEHKAPTEESIRLMEEMHQKVLDNIISKVQVDDNLITGGQCFLCAPGSTGKWNYRIVFKFSINGKEFVIYKEVDQSALWDAENSRLISDMKLFLKNEAYAVILWYACKMLPSVVYEQITGNKPPQNLLP